MSNGQKKSTVQIRDTKEWDRSKLEYQDLQTDGDFIAKSNVYMSFPQYEKKNPVAFRTKWIVLNYGGIPKYNPKYADNERNYMKFVFDPAQPNAMEVRTIVAETDEDIREKHLPNILKKKWGTQSLSSIEYIDTIRPAYEPEPTDENYEKYKDMTFHENMKMRFDTDFATKALKTVVYIQNKETGERRPETFNSIEELEKVFTYGCMYRLVFTNSRLGIDKQKKDIKKKDTKKEARSAYKIMQMIIIPSESRGASSEAFRQDLFDDDVEAPPMPKTEQTSEETGDASPVVKTKTTKKSAPPPAESSEEENSDDDDPPPPKKPVVKKPSPKGGDSSDEESDDDAPPKPAPKGKKGKK